MPILTELHGPNLCGPAASSPNLISSPLRVHHGPIHKSRNEPILKEETLSLLQDSFLLTRMRCLGVREKLSFVSDSASEAISAIQIMIRGRLNQEDHGRAALLSSMSGENVTPNNKAAQPASPPDSSQTPNCGENANIINETIETAATIHCRALAAFIPWDDPSNLNLLCTLEKTLKQTTIQYWTDLGLIEVLCWMYVTRIEYSAI